MKVGLIQSCYLPWRGYFDFIDDVDLFVFYDDVQYTRQDWRNRNLIKTASGSTWITVPVHYRHDRGTLIQDTRIDHSQAWQRKHVNKITNAYRSSPHFSMYADELFSQLNFGHETISELNIALTKWLMECFSIRVPVRESREYSVCGDKNDRIIDLLKQLGGQEYLVGPAAKSYLDESAFKKEGIKLTYKSYEYKPYPQLHGDFEPRVSALDLLLCCGPESRKYIKSTKINVST